MVKTPKTPANQPVDKIGRRNTIIILICIFLIFGVLLWILIYPFIRPNFDRAYRTKAGILTPTQIETIGSQPIQGDGWSGFVRYRAKYTVWGLVMNNTSYNSDSLYDKMSPLDIGLAWGEMAENNHLIKWVRGYRHVTASINAYSGMFIRQDDEKLFKQYSNNHLIFTDPELLKKAQGLQLGDYVKIQGYLVDAEAHKSNEPAIKYNLYTSLTRDDEGEDSREVILVTKLEILD
ncbi:hypothetical protein IJM16_04765 [Candidatus Saccharibacteria bacterium]|nr:hypothetical protein [Candidatus Saccharibacteria bacterium]